MSAGARRGRVVSPASARVRGARLKLRARLAWRAIVSRFSSSLTRRIVVLNLGGLLVLVVGFLYLNQFRADIIDARVQSLRTQGEIIAAAIAASAAVETNTITVDPEKLLQLAPGESAAPTEGEDESIEFSINPERVGPVLRRLVTPTRTRARIYDRDGLLLLDSLALSSRGVIMHSDPGEAGAEDTTGLDRAWIAIKRWFVPAKKRRVDEPWVGNSKSHPEVADALRGQTQSVVRVDADGETIVSVGVPIQQRQAVRGALLLSTQGGDIDAVIASERWAILRFFLVLAAVMFILSMFLAGTIAEPVRKLAEAAERVRRGIKSRQQIPDFTARSDEIGHLSHALRDMTQALYNRIDAIESFAADVAHELKNPLTSLRSAVEILPRVKAGASRDRLLEVIQHDVRRLDRLISDISDASRLDAELARNDAQPIDMIALLRAVVSMAEDSSRHKGVKVRLSIDGAVHASDKGAPRYCVLGHDSRLAQVMTNLIDNARSFSEPGGEVRVALRRLEILPDDDSEDEGARILVTVEDDGPGIPSHALERIFERFYTDRPSQGFGQNSGLGLSISRQIVEAHGGRIWAQNRPAPVDAAPPVPHASALVDSAYAEETPGDDGDQEDEIVRHGAGARFVISLPAAAL
ncbi:stimulus-sensing domain-containing protein [Methylocapsa sp. S129]|uniref:stimulus-sensing domain-containing protein n=1 Tax=Methylocapsa sp. S129 TaxID=1641869 RepID=UPI00131E94BB|nr:stimulus-sensing domain-containing protein [Methylocapsa sp. S129]